MCGSCGCGDSELVPVHVHESLLSANDRDAEHNREHLLDAGIYTVNLMGSPGAGKTALLEAIAKRIGGEKLRAISGDLATDNDGERLRAAGMSALTITTGQACHLDARMVHQALHGLDLQGAQYFFIENVGNLVCPAIYDLGQAANVVLLSVTEGEDKPLKYPVMFRVADLVVVSKSDLLKFLPNINVDRIKENLSKVTSTPQLLTVSATTGEGLDDLTEWLKSRRREQLEKPGGGAHGHARTASHHGEHRHVGRESHHHHEDGSTHHHGGGHEPHHHHEDGTAHHHTSGGEPHHHHEDGTAHHHPSGSEPHHHHDDATTHHHHGGGVPHRHD